MMRSMFAGVTGLRNHQIRMDSIGNNIANVNTVGYKASRVSFQDTLNQTLRGSSAPNGNRGGINAVQVGLGMNLASIDVMHTQGNLQNTGRTTDCAIQGDGFFIVSDGSRQYYTRAGNFNMERDGRLVNPSNGMIVRGWMADNLGVINTNSPLENIQLPVGQTIAPIATTEIQFGGNLDKNLDGLLEYTSLTVGSPNGETCTIEVELTPTGFNQYQYQLVTSNPGVTLSATTGTIILNADGTVNSATPANFNVVFPSGASVPVTSPITGGVEGGFFRTMKPANDTILVSPFPGMPVTFPAAPAWYTIRDDQGNSCEVRFTIDNAATWPNTGDYNWDMVVNGANTTLAAGSGGIIHWDNALGQFTASTGGATITNIASGLDIYIGPPVTGTNTPTFRVLQREGNYDGNFTQAQSMVTITRVYDSLGTNHTLTTTVTKTAVNNWDWVTTDEGGVVVGNGHLVFNSVGELISSTGTNITFTPPGAQTVTITPNFEDVTQYAGGLIDPRADDYDPTIPRTEITSPFQDGYPMGELQGFNIDKTGIIIGVFSNGMNQNLAQLAVANFTNPGGLVRSGDTLFEESSNSGTPQIGVAGRNGRGLVTPGAIEMSNVDLSQEFTDMIMTERGFQSNSRVITTSDEMLQELVNLKR